MRYLAAIIILSVTAIPANATELQDAYAVCRQHVTPIPNQHMREAWKFSEGWESCNEIEALLQAEQSGDQKASIDLLLRRLKGAK